MSRLRQNLFLSVLLVVPALVAALLNPVPQARLEAVASIIWLTCSLALLGGGCVLYFSWRINAHPVIAWHSVGMISVALHIIPFAMLGVTTPAQVSQWPTNTIDVSLALPLPVLVILAAREVPFPKRFSPVVAGTALALLTIALRLVRGEFAPNAVEDVQAAAPILLPALIGLIGLATCMSVTRVRALPPVIRRRLATAAAALFAARALISWDDGPTAQLLFSAICVTASVSLVVIAMSVFKINISESHGSRQTLVERAKLAEDLIRKDAEVLHELRASVAGLNTASRLLLRRDSPVPRTYRTHLEEMLQSEMGRVERLLDRQAITAPERVCIDEVIRPLVVGQRALGREVLWELSGYQAVCRPDDVAEAVHILLTNAACHAPGSVVTVSVLPGACRTTIRVSDAGPGVAPDVVDNLFDWGSRNSRSQGQGIGLHVAQRILREQGGDLRLERSNSGGTTFLIDLPAVRHLAS